MDKKSILLLTKDAQCKSYYPIYGNKYWKGKMPNLEELASKGTIFNRFYTAAPSSNMSYLSMFTMKYPYMHDIKKYVYLIKDYTGKTLFDLMKERGFVNHIIWDDAWDPDIKYTRCYGDSIIHSIHDLRQGVGCHYHHASPLIPNDEIAERTLENFISTVDSIASSDEMIFLWCHLPHVLNGRVGYGGDMDLYDKYIGVFRKYFTDDNIFISADHGNMNGHKGKVCYGFDVYESSINIPLITPRINDLEICNENISNIDLHKIILNRDIPKREIIISDSAYYAQPKRKTAFLLDNFVYIFNKATNEEELYDLEWDPYEEFSLISDVVYDSDRNTISLSSEYYFYPKWEQLPAIRNRMRAEKNKIWRIETRFQKVAGKLRTFLSNHKMVKQIAKKISFYEKWK